MAITSSNTPAQLRKNVTSPNGTTQAALEVFDRAQISQNIQAALAAAQNAVKNWHKSSVKAANLQFNF